MDERLARYIVDGTRDGLTADLERKLDEGPPPSTIINGPLMAGMAEVGRLFSDNQLIVAEVLQSAEVDEGGGGLPGALHGRRPRPRTPWPSVLLATVKGDVHDIGKNLVDIILANNGFEVVNLGIRVPREV